MGLTNLNPFSLEPVRMPTQFFGREKETRQALGFLCQSQNVSVVGPAKIGRTSFLLHVAHPDMRAQYRLTKEHVFVHLDSRSLSDCDRGLCYLSIIEQTVRQVKSTESEIAP